MYHRRGNTPYDMASLAFILQLRTTFYFRFSSSFHVAATGLLITCGSNTSYQLGYERENHDLRPGIVELSQQYPISLVGCGDMHTIVVTTGMIALSKPYSIFETIYCYCCNFTSFSVP